MFNTSEIMKKAWALFRKEWIGARPANAAARMRSFARCLKSAWMTAKYEAAEELKTLKQKAAEKLTELFIERIRVQAKPFGMNIAGAAKAIEAEIAALGRRAA